MTPLWIICGQIAQSNYAAARYLILHYGPLMKTYGTKKSFCLALQLIDSQDYGHNQLEVVGDFTGLAFNKPIES
jgi:hypothetical protein